MLSGLSVWGFFQVLTGCVSLTTMTQLVCGIELNSKSSHKKNLKKEKKLGVVDEPQKTKP